MNKYQQTIQIRTRKLGLLMQDARLTSQRSQEDCAKAIGIPTDRYDAYESGHLPPTLPELELFAFYLKVPMDYFWGSQLYSDSQIVEEKQPDQQFVQLRNRKIGVQLKQLRKESNLTLEQLAEKSLIPAEQLTIYENAAQDIPITDLEILANAIGTQIETFFDQNGPVGIWTSQQVAIKKFLDLPEDVQDFVSHPINHPYLDIAIHLSQLPADRLRSIAESLLEITY